MDSDRIARIRADLDEVVSRGGWYVTNARNDIPWLLSQLESLTARAVRAEEDTKRLDWLSDPAKGNVTIGLNTPPLIPECSLYIGDALDEPYDAGTLREAIDRASAPRPATP